MTADVPASGALPDRAPPDRSTAPQSPATARQIAIGAAIAGTIAIVVLALVFGLA